VTVPDRPPTIVLDASVGVPLIRDEPTSLRVSQRMHELREAGNHFVVPSLFWLEIVNVLGRRFRGSPQATLEAVVELEAAGLETVELDRPMLLLAIDAVVRHGLTAHDAAYLALADAADARLLTADAVLAAAAGPRGLLVGSTRRVREPRAKYRADETATWAEWPGAAAYLRELRARAIAFQARNGRPGSEPRAGREVVSV
jgi:predicted nucleic acid-binding protein